MVEMQRRNDTPVLTLCYYIAGNSGPFEESIASNQGPALFSKPWLDTPCCGWPSRYGQCRLEGRVVVCLNIFLGLPMPRSIISFAFDDSGSSSSSRSPRPLFIGVWFDSLPFPLLAPDG